MNKRNVQLTVVIMCLGVLGPIIHYALLGGASTASLKPASPLAGIISQSLTTSGSSTSLPQEGKDYAIAHTEYFADAQWAVVFIKPLNSSINAAVIILEKQNLVYHTVLGPGSSFPASSANNLPASIVQYLNAQGVVYEPAVL